MKFPGRRFKIKAVVGANRATAREADYVESKTMEKIYSIENPPKVLFDKDTSIFGYVTHRKATVSSQSRRDRIAIGAFN